MCAWFGSRVMIRSPLSDITFTSVSRSKWKSDTAEACS